MTGTPADLAERLFRALFDDFDLITVDGTYIALPSDGTVLAFYGATLAEVAGQISERTTDMPNPFEVNEERALDGLLITWGDLYQIRVTEGLWQAWHCDDPAGKTLTGSTPDEVNQKIRADWAGRQ